MPEPTSDPFDIKLDRIAEQVDAIARFVGQTAELQMQTQYKLDEMMELNRQTHIKLDRMTETIQGYQDIAREQARSTAELIKLVTVLSSKAS
ncbi:MAG: hypothetical protein AB4042_07635 [Leptolyngbyaceae cyanobacterium]